MGPSAADDTANKCERTVAASDPCSCGGSPAPVRPDTALAHSRCARSRIKPPQTRKGLPPTPNLKIAEFFCMWPGSVRVRQHET